MNNRIIELAEEAGFCFWGDEDWKPHGAIIDWSADYDREFQKYTELLIKECIVDFYSRYLDINSVENITIQVEKYINDFGIE